jgi:hypothetical protein
MSNSPGSSFYSRSGRTLGRVHEHSVGRKFEGGDETDGLVVF